MKGYNKRIRYLKKYKNQTGRNANQAKGMEYIYLEM